MLTARFFISADGNGVLPAIGGCFFSRFFVYTFAVLGTIPGTVWAPTVNVQS